jgi:DNA mismatch repair protein MutS
MAALETAGLEAISKRHRDWLHTWTPVWSTLWAAALSDLLVWRASSIALENWCAELDVSWTVGSIATEWSWTRPVFIPDAGSSVEVTGLRHPILERLTKVPYVSHSLVLKEGEAGLLLYGMNASGKSSLMKALGLCVLLAQTGFPVPATGMRLAPFTAIFTRILGNDNLWAGLSSFAVEMTEFREILQLADERSLVLGDELCSGTESLSATALVAAGVETLAVRGTKFVFATHLHELAALIPASVKTFHLRVNYDAATDQLIYDRRLEPGSGSALYGLEVCRALDLPTGYLDRATSIRKQLAGVVSPHRSVYSADCVVDRCGVCGSECKGLEVHHIQHQAAGVDNKASNLVCLCTRCHDDHHGGRLVIEGWKETATGRILAWTRSVSVSATEEAEVKAWVVEQKSRKIRVPTIQRLAKQQFGVDLTVAAIRGF